jgi:hypothetical protein
MTRNDSPASGFKIEGELITDSLVTFTICFSVCYHPKRQLVCANWKVEKDDAKFERNNKRLGHTKVTVQYSAVGTGY